MNTQRLRECVQYFKDEPSRLFMQDWIMIVGTSSPLNPPCGTVACLAGSAIVIESSKQKEAFQETIERITGRINGGSSSLRDTALILFDIDSRQGSRLFIVDNWPCRYRSPYLKIEGSLFENKHPHVHAHCKKMLVEILRDRVTYFIQTNGLDKKIE